MPDNNPNIDFTVNAAETVMAPVDATLSIAGQAADAKATGDALALKADKSEIVDITVNGQGADRQGSIIVTAEHVPMDDNEAQTVAEAMDDKMPLNLGNLNALSGVPASGDMLVVRHGSQTYRVDYDALESAIGALPLSGGTMTGDIDMGQSTASSSGKRLVWTTADGTVFRLRPYNNVMQLTRQVPGSAEANAFGIYSDGTFLVPGGSWPVTIGGTGGTTPEQGRTNLSVYSKAEVDSFVGAKLYSVRGNIVKSASTGTAIGYGKAVVYIVGKTVVVEFEAKITTAGTLSGVYDIGIQVANLRTINSGIPAFTVSNGGIIHYYKDDGAMDTRLEGYAGEASLNTSENRWAFGRLNDTSGSIGAWADNNYSAGKIITGTLYGVLN